MNFVLLLPVIILTVLLLEKILHAYWIRQIPLRISVNGTRGKSSVTEFIYAGLRAGGKQVFGKTTGTEPLVHLPGGEKKPIRRRGSPRIQEQMKVVYWAAKEHVDVLVAECMAVTPEYQVINSRMILPQIYVITNILDDHREHYAGNLDLYAAAICKAIPEKAIVVTGEEKYLPLIQQIAEQRDTKVVLASRTTHDDAPGGIIAANLDLALEVCVQAGVERQIAIEGIVGYAKTNMEPIVSNVRSGFQMINGLAVNDTSSAEKLFMQWQSSYENSIILLHTRNDRPLRTIQFAEWIAHLPNIKIIILTGTHTMPANRLLRKLGITENRILEWGTRLPGNLENVLSGESTLFGFGNTGHEGLIMWNDLKRRIQE